MTRVDECTKADTGVGAAMAAGSHDLNGNWALLVHAAITKIINPQTLGKIWADSPKGMEKDGDININGRAVRIKLSPNRLVIPVINPALNDLALL